MSGSAAKFLKIYLVCSFVSEGDADGEIGKAACISERLWEQVKMRVIALQYKTKLLEACCVNRKAFN